MVALASSIAGIFINMQPDAKTRSYGPLEPGSSASLESLASLERSVREAVAARMCNRVLPVREKPQNLFPLKFISNSKRSNFENRTESVEARASERNGLSENNKPALPIGSPKLKREIATVTGLNCQRVRPENTRPWAIWRREWDTNPRYGRQGFGPFQ
jgi:hypothetical protein